MALTGRIIRWHTATIAGVAVTKVTDFSLDASGSTGATGEDDDVYMTDQFAQDVLVTGSVTLKDVHNWDALSVGTTGTSTVSGADSDGVTDHTFTIVLSMVTSKPLTGPRGWASYVANFQAVSADGTTSPVSIA